MNRMKFPFLGFGVGMRRQHHTEIVEKRPRMDWFEVISENFMVAGGPPLHVLAKVREHYPIVMHGVSMSIGSADPLNRRYLRDLKRLAREFQPAWISDHLCWTGVGGRNLHDLLPIPYNEETLAFVARRIREVQDILERRVLFENISSYMKLRDSTIPEWQFVAEVAEAADCAILLDINNIYVNAFNHRFDARSYIDAIPRDRVAQFHLAGHTDRGTHLLDTHDHPVCDDVWDLYEYASRRFGSVSTLIEWDDNIPTIVELAATANRARQIHDQTINAPPPRARAPRRAAAPAFAAPHSA